MTALSRPDPALDLALDPGAGPRSQSGSALIEMTWLGILLLVPLVFLVLAVLEVQRAAFASTAAARAAGRAFVLAPDPATGHARAQAAARLAATDQGIDPGGSRIQLSCRPACLVPGSVVQVRVSRQVPLPWLPAVLGDQAPSVAVDASQAVPYGTYREDRS